MILKVPKTFLLKLHWALISIAIFYVCFNNINQNVRIAFDLPKAETFGFYIVKYFGYSFSSFFILFLTFLLFYCGIFLLLDMGKILKIVRNGWGTTNNIFLPAQLLFATGVLIGIPSILAGKYRSCVWGDFGGGDGNYIFWISLTGYLMALLGNEREKVKNARN